MSAAVPRPALTGAAFATLLIFAQTTGANDMAAHVAFKLGAEVAASARMISYAAFSTRPSVGPSNAALSLRCVR